MFTGALARIVIVAAPLRPANRLDPLNRYSAAAADTAPSQHSAELAEVRPPSRLPGGRGGARGPAESAPVPHPGPTRPTQPSPLRGMFFRQTDPSRSTWPVVVPSRLPAPAGCGMGDHRRTVGRFLIRPQRAGALSRVVPLLDPPAREARHLADQVLSELLDLLLRGRRHRLRLLRLLRLPPATRLEQTAAVSPCLQVFDCSFVADAANVVFVGSVDPAS